MANPRQFNPYIPDATYEPINIVSYGTAALTDTSDALNSIIAHINATELQRGAIYLPPRVYTVKTDITIPSNVHLIFERGAKLSPDSGKTVTIAGTLDAPMSQVFGGSGTVTLSGVIDKIYPQWWGAKGDGTTDDTAAINAAITAANAVTTSTIATGVTVYFPAGLYLCNSAITAPSRNIRLLGASGAVWSTTRTSASVFKAGFQDDALFDLGSSSSNVTFENLGFYGGQTSAGGSLNHNAIEAASANNLRVKGCSFTYWGGSAVKVSAGTNKWVEHTQTTNCLMAYGDLADYQGVLHFAGTENNFVECNINGPAFTASTHSSAGSGYQAAVYLAGAPISAYKLVAAFSQTGIVISGGVTNSPSTFVACRADFNQGHGWIINGSDCSFVRCTAYGNSLDTDNTYDGFYTVRVSPNFALRNDYTDCVVTNYDGSYRTRYAFTDQNNGAGNVFAYANRYDAGCRGASMGTRKFNSTVGSTPPIIQTQNYRQALSGTGTQTFDGESGNIWHLTVNANTATTIAAQNLLPGVVYYLYITQHSGAPTITLDTVFAKKAFTSPAASKQVGLVFRSDGTSLYQMGASTGDM